jgi:hypothetical protein
MANQPSRSPSLAATAFSRQSPSALKHRGPRHDALVEMKEPGSFKAANPPGSARSLGSWIGEDMKLDQPAFDRALQLVSSVRIRPIEGKLMIPPGSAREVVSKSG